MALTKVSSKTLSDNAVTSDKIAAGAISVSDMADNSITAAKLHTSVQGALGTRNLIINGDMRIAQRGTSATGLGNNDTGYYTIDRWKFVEAGAPTGTGTMSQDTDVPTGQGFSNSLKYEITTAQDPMVTTDQVRFEQAVEAQNLQHLKYGTSSAETLTLSFWIKSNVTGTYIIWVYSEDGARSISLSYTIDTADTWEKKTITIDGDDAGTINNDNGEGLRCVWYVAAGPGMQQSALATTWRALTTGNRCTGQVNLMASTSNYINITGVQLEVGDTATEFEHRPYDMELQRCYRYYYRINYSGAFPAFSQRNTGVYNTTSQLVVGYNLPVSMRGSITGSFSDITHFDIEPFDAEPSSILPTGSNSEFNGYTVRVTDPTARTTGFAGKLNCDVAGGYIDFDAEL